MELNKNDLKLIELAKKLVNENKDLCKENREVVGSILLAKSGKTYKGINIKTSHSICAEQVALGQAFACGERDFDTIVAVMYEPQGNTRVVTPCGLCRYTLERLGLDINVIVADPQNDTLLKVKAKDLLPYQYKR